MSNTLKPGVKRISAGQVVTTLFLILIALAQLFPLFWLFNYSLQKSTNLFGPKLIDFPEVPQWSNYVRAWSDGRIPQYLMNSLLVVAASIFFIMLFSFTIAYACTRMKWKLRSLVYNFVLLGMVIPIHTTLLPNFVWFKQFGLIDSHLSLIIPYTAFFLAFSVLMFSGFLHSLPFAMEESAYLDGASIGTILLKIIAPMAKSGFVTVGIMAFLNCWNEFIMANTFLASESKRTLPFSIIRFEGEYASDYAVQFACMTIVAIIPIAIYFIFSKRIIAGVTAGAVKVEDPMPESNSVAIENPILPGFNADPSAIRVGEDYYVITSTFNWLPGIPLYHSRDLKNWTLRCHLLDRREQLDLRGNPESCGVWAPQISFNPGTGLFYLVYTDVKNLSGSFFDLNNYAASAPSPEGPWSEPVYLNSSGFDPSLFHDGDGRSWLLNLAWEFREGYPHPGPIVMQEFDCTTLSLTGSSRVIYRGNPRFGCTEGPHLYKREGWYYLMTAEGGTGYGHAVKIARSRSIEGPYEESPLGPLLTSRLNPDPDLPKPDPSFLKPRFFNPGLRLQKPGHGSLVETPQGETVLFHLCARPVMPQLRCTLNRETGIQKVLWREGWPVVSGNPPYPSDTVRFVLREGAPHDVTEPGIMTFDGPDLPFHFYSLKDRMDESWCSLKRKPGVLSLRGRNSPYSAHDLSLVARRIQHFDCDIETRMDFRPENSRRMAGLVLQTGSRTFYYFRYYYSDTLQSPCLGLMISLNGDLHEEARIPLAYEGPIRLKAALRTRTLQFSYSRDGVLYRNAGALQDATVLSDEFTNNGPGAFDGTFAGMCVHDLDRRTAWAEFHSFSYLPLDSQAVPEQTADPEGGEGA